MNAKVEEAVRLTLAAAAMCPACGAYLYVNLYHKCGEPYREGGPDGRLIEPTPMLVAAAGSETYSDPPSLYTSTGRTHCEACGDALVADEPHHCGPKHDAEGSACIVPGTGNIDAEGAAPVREQDAILAEDAEAVLTEQQKYERMWSFDQYRQVAPGEGAAMHFLGTAKPRYGSTIIDFGAGTGRGALMIALLGRMKVKMVDFADNCLDPEVRDALTTQSHALSFTKADLSVLIPFTEEYGYCTDVMEHIPPEQVDRVLANILASAQHVYFQISCTEDSCGALIGHPLHLSVHEPNWWLAKFMALKCQVHFWKDDTTQCTAYVTAWASGREIVDKGEINTEVQEVLDHVRQNSGPQYADLDLSDPNSPGVQAARYAVELFAKRCCHEEDVTYAPEPFEVTRVVFDAHGAEVHYLPAGSDLEDSNHVSFKDWEEALDEEESMTGAPAPRGFRWQQLRPYERQSREVMILGGGPSLEGQLEEIKRLQSEGCALVTLNGAYNWAQSKGLTISATVVVDAREFNARFTHPVEPNPQTMYLIASQCHPKVLEGLPPDRTFLWNTSAEMIQGILEEAVGPGKWFGVVGGCTVLLRAIPLLHMLGYCQFHLFGCDSCTVLEPFPIVGKPMETHHAYAQPENDGVPTFPTIVGGRTFHCTAWQAAQATEFMELIRVMGNEFELEVHGDGLLAWILQHGYDLDVEAEECQEQQSQAAPAPA